MTASIFSGILTAEPLHMVTVEIPPVGYIENGQTVGAFYDISDELGKRIGMEYTRKIKPYSRVIHELKNGTSDLSFIVLNTSLDGYVVHLAPIIKTQVIVLRGSADTLNTLSDLNGKRIGILRKGTYIKNVFDGSKITTFSVKNYQQGIKLLKAGRLDALAGLDIGIYFAIKQLNYKKNDFSTPFIIRTLPVTMQITKKMATPELINKLNVSVTSMQKDGTIARILKKYVGDYYTYLIPSTDNN